MKNTSKIAFITGITGQDGAYLAQLLLSKGYEVHGLQRRSSSSNTSRLDDLLSPYERKNITLHYGDMTDSTSLIRLISLIKPTEVYNLAAQSHVAVSFETPEYTAQADGLGVLRLLEALRILGLHNTKFYQASTSELFGQVVETPQSESTPFNPRSPYAVAKLYAYWIIVNYRQAYNMFACNGILFNHESPLRGETFVTRKITLAVSRIVAGLQDELVLGNLDALRDWGYAPDYVYAMWLMLQQETPEDFVIATGTCYRVRDFVERAFAYAGRSLVWQGAGVDEVAIDALTGKIVVRCDARYYRPTEVDILCGDATKAREKLGWQPTVTFEKLVEIMMEADMTQASHKATPGDPSICFTSKATQGERPYKKVVCDVV